MCSDASMPCRVISQSCRLRLSVECISSAGVVHRDSTDNSTVSRLGRQACSAALSLLNFWTGPSPRAVRLRVTATCSAPQRCTPAWRALLCLALHFELNGKHWLSQPVTVQLTRDRSFNQIGASKQTFDDDGMQARSDSRGER